MNLIPTVLKLLIVFCLCLSMQMQFANAQDSVVELTLHPQNVPSNPDAIRLLPREHELRDGNAAIELLRMPWEQSNFMKLKSESMSDWLEMKGDDPELSKWDSAFMVFKTKMRRAAYIRDADWDYPIGEQPLGTITLPDVQGMRSFVGRVMSLWIRIQISKGNLRGAEEGILIQMANARHVCATPFAVCQLVGAAIVRLGFSELENLIQHPESKNCYYALGMLPDSFGDFNAAVDLDFQILSSSMPSIADQPVPPTGSPVWKTAFDELSKNYIMAFTMLDDIDPDSMKRQAKIAIDDLKTSKTFSNDDLAAMSKEEATVRWLLAASQKIKGKYVAAIQLPAHEAIQELVIQGEQVQKLNEKFVLEQPAAPEGTVQNEFFTLCSVQTYLACHRTGRQAKLLQIVEAIRHYASGNANKLPESLEDIDLRIPRDPFTDKAAIYKLAGDTAILKWPTIPNVDPSLEQSPTYELKIAIKK